ncbi:MAG: glutamate--tRNA ligase [Betaproteobacteria bacterium]|nr:glutamate--tRNA ligase [Betaproteobacteria bacterium]
MTPSNQRPVRVRIAPSPTGDPHIGTAYIALFNYAFAKKHGGKFIVRIEDTDQTRFRKDSEAMILESLRWVGLPWDEGPDVGGPHAPYRQSERTQLYREYAQVLLDKGHAYRCFCSGERLESVRKERMAQKLQGGYDRQCRNLSAEESALRAKNGESFTIRMKMPLTGKTIFNDGLRGDLEFENDGIDDQVLLKSDGFPTYHLANVVDDHEMQISHVIRGEEWISSTPKHVVLYDMFGWQRPEFTHLPLLRNADKSKISKRKQPTSINYYRRKGILPDALRNYLALMGWSYGEDKEIFSTSEMVEHFELQRMTLGGPVFDLEKLAWLNGHYMRAMSTSDYVHFLQRELFSTEHLQRIVPLIRDRIEKFEDFIGATHFFFSGDLKFDAALLLPKGRSPADTAQALADALDALETIEAWTVAEITNAMEQFLVAKNLKAKDIYMPLRVATTGAKETPPLFESLEVIGKEMVRRRVRCAIGALNALAASSP